MFSLLIIDAAEFWLHVGVVDQTNFFALSQVKFLRQPVEGDVDKKLSFINSKPPNKLTKRHFKMFIIHPLSFKFPYAKSEHSINKTNNKNKVIK